MRRIGSACCITTSVLRRRPSAASFLRSAPKGTEEKRSASWPVTSASWDCHPQQYGWSLRLHIPCSDGSWPIRRSSLPIQQSAPSRRRSLPPGLRARCPDAGWTGNTDNGSGDRSLLLSAPRFSHRPYRQTSHYMGVSYSNSSRMIFFLFSLFIGDCPPKSKIINLPGGLRDRWQTSRLCHNLH